MPGKPNDKPNAPATIRNREAIRDVLAIEFKHATNVLEIGSGTGQHAVYFAGEFPNLVWQTSDRPDHHSGICAWLDDSDLQNVRRPLQLDVLISPTPAATFDAVFSANTAHIMSFDAVTSMFRLVANCLADRGVFCLYGPFNEDGAFTSPSNEKFDLSLKGQNPEMGIRNIEELDELGRQNGMQRIRTFAMPANNQIAVWQVL